MPYLNVQMEAQAAQIVALREAHALAVAVIEKSPNQSTPALQQPPTQGLGQVQGMGQGQAQVVGQGLGQGQVQGMGQGHGQAPSQAALSINDLYRCVHAHTNPYHHLHFHSHIL